MKRLLQLITKPQPPYRTVRLDPIHTGNVRRFRVYAVSEAKDPAVLQEIILDLVEIARGKTSAVVFVFIYHDEQEVGRGMPVARGLFVRSNVPKAYKPTGIPGYTVEVENGTVTIDIPDAN